MKKENEEAGDEYAEIPPEENPGEITKKMIIEIESKKIKSVEKSLEEIESDKRKIIRGEKTREQIIAIWKPKTKLGRDVKSGKIKNIDEVLESNKKILEPEIVDGLINVKSDLIFIGQSKGKFGGGKRRAWRQTQRKTEEGNIPTFSTMAIIGDENGHIGIGSGESKETLPARDKAIRKAKLNIIKINRTCSAFDCSCD